MLQYWQKKKPNNKKTPQKNTKKTQTYGSVASGKLLVQNAESINSLPRGSSLESELNDPPLYTIRNL